jgi:predicted RNA-binding Zn-ribbon protein involved in translation (DUF1610 family)
LPPPPPWWLSGKQTSGEEEEPTCLICGARLIENSKICPNCGERNF